jgi:hypothetical protein
MKKFPKKIRILSDDTNLIFIEEVLEKGKKLPVRLAKYEYIKAKVFLGNTVILQFPQIESLYRDGRLDILE